MAGSFEQINNYEDFRREVDRARTLCKKHLIQMMPGNPTLLSVDMQLKFIQSCLKANRKPTVKERRSIDMAHRMAREFESGYDKEFYAFKELISILNLYIEYWPTDKLASDPNNEDKIDWDREL